MRWAARPTFYRDIGVISAGGAGFYVYNLESVPVSTFHSKTHSFLGAILPLYLPSRTGQSFQSMVLSQGPN